MMCSGASLQSRRRILSAKWWQVPMKQTTARAPRHPSIVPETLPLGACSYHSTRIAPLTRKGSFGSARRMLSNSTAGRQFYPRALSTQPVEWKQKQGETTADVVDGGSAVIVSFPQGQESLFHAPWLWCNDPSFIHPSSGQRLHSPSSYFGWKLTSSQVVTAADNAPEDDNAMRPIPPPPAGCLHPVGCVYESTAREDADTTTDDRAMLRVTWERDSETFVSFYDMDWLWDCRYDDEALENHRASTEILPGQALCHNTSMFNIDYSLLVSDHDDTVDARFEFLHAILRDGAALVQNTPADVHEPTAPVAALGRALAGSLSHGHLYGDTFHVQSSSNPHNIAYTSVPLPPHQDLAYYQSAPGLQLLNCVNNRGVTGGESTLVDALAAANAFRQLAPDLFHFLVSCEATFLKQRKGADIVYYRPHIVQDSFGNITSVHWSPPFEGPGKIAAHELDEYYLAYAAFESMLDNSLPSHIHLPLSNELSRSLRDYANKHTWEQRLNPGEVLVFNNQRMLHGRRGFALDDSEGPGDRHLAGCYTNMEETLSEYRLLRRERLQGGNVAPVPNAGNGSSGSI